MAETPRETVLRTLTRTGPSRIPRATWINSRWLRESPDAVQQFQQRWPSDLGTPANPYLPSARVKGNMTEIGTYVDEWGCSYENIQRDVVGEVKEPLIADLRDWKDVAPPFETLPTDRAAAQKLVNASCASKPIFWIAETWRVRLWERYQFLRGTENAMMDLAEGSDECLSLLKRIHDYNMQDLSFWASTNVDALFVSDDWGSQCNLLISPDMWRSIFKPLYKAYADLAKAHGKFLFLHSDGHIAAIIPDLIEIGYHAVNAQVFCMDQQQLSQLGQNRMTWYGELCRQHILPSNDPKRVHAAIQQVAKNLGSKDGGIIGQFEWGKDVDATTAGAVMQAWDAVEDRWYGSFHK